MFTYRTPGVYFDAVDNRSEALGLVRTDIAGFVGLATRGPVNRPVKIRSWTQFVSLFGAHAPQAFLAYAVEGFFSNGGDTCWVVRAADPDSARPAEAVLNDDRGNPALRLSAAARIEHTSSAGTNDPSRLNGAQGRDPANDVEADPGVWGNQIAVTVRWASSVPIAGPVRGADPVRFTLTVARPGEPQEAFPDLSLDPEDDRYVVNVLNGVPLPPRRRRPESRRPRASSTSPRGSRLVSATDLRTSRDPGSILAETFTRLSGGHDGLAPSTLIPDGAGKDCLRIVATPAGPFGRVLQAVIAWDEDPARFALTVRDLLDDQSAETWDGLTLDPADPKYVVTVVNNRRKGAATAGGGSRLVTVRDQTPPISTDPRTGAALRPKAAAAGHPIRPQSGVYQLSGGLSPAHLTGVGDPMGRKLGLSALEAIDEVSIVALPDLWPPQPLPVRPVKARPPRCDGPEPDLVTPAPVPEAPPETAPVFTAEQVAALYNALVLHAELLKDRIVLLDPPPLVAGIAGPSVSRDRATDDGEQTQRVLAWLDRQVIDSRYAALYYPWLLVDDPLTLDGSVRPVPPSGHLAGICTRADRDFGVHKPPANMEVLGARDVTDRVGEIAHGDLNDRGVNVVRPYSGRGIRVYGARTLSSDPSWRFLNVRRLLLMIEIAIDRQTQWVVFEPNNTGLRGDLDRVIRTFLNDLWERGMLDGVTPDDAFEVRCDETTNPPEEADAGRLICVLGVRPPAPAEFVIVRIGKTLEGTVVLEDA